MYCNSYVGLRTTPHVTLQTLFEVKEVKNEIRMTITIAVQVCIIIALLIGDFELVPGSCMTYLISVRDLLFYLRICQK